MVCLYVCVFASWEFQESITALAPEVVGLESAQESQERITALAAEVVGLESGLLQWKSGKLKADKQLEAKDQQVRMCISFPSSWRCGLPVSKTDAPQ
eukprot:scaffold221389_cov18-Tisochrysis_lutea.AAC.1